MGVMASQITSFTSVYLNVHSGVDQEKHQSSAWLTSVRGIHRWPVNSPRKWPVTRKMFIFDDVIMFCNIDWWDYIFMCAVSRAVLSQSGIVITRSKMTRWRHQMETFSTLLALCAGNSPVTGEFPSQRPVARRFDVFFDLRSNKRLSKHSWGWWFETPSRPLWRHCYDAIQHEVLQPRIFNIVLGSIFRITFYLKKM